MTYITDIKHLLARCECDSTIYQREPVKAEGEIRPLTLKERREVERLSTERGYRPFRAERMGV